MPRKNQWMSEEQKRKIGDANRGKSHPRKFFDCDRAVLQSFKGCHNRVRDGKSPSIAWERNQKGYEAFAKEIGPKPNDGRKWSVGRKDHKKGYINGNIKWQLHVENSCDRKYPSNGRVK